MIDIIDLSVRLGEKQIFQRFSESLPDHGIVLISGESGIGKTTLLRVLCGLQKPDRGTVIGLKGRKISFVFQESRLLNYMTALQNAAIVSDDQKADDLLRRLNMQEAKNVKACDLSGGQRQRVALGRAIVREPKVFLMDEPLSNLDAKLRALMRTEIIKLHQRLQTTIIYVTHDQTEAMTMGSRIVVMKDGYIQQVESPQVLYEKPVNMFVAGFIGSPQMNFAIVRVEKSGSDVLLRLGRWTVKLPERKAQVLEHFGYIDKEVVMGIRPEHVHDEPVYLEQFSDCIIESTIDVVELLGSESLLYFTIEDTNFVSRVKPRHNVYVGDTMKFAINPERVHIFDKDTENVITN